MNINHQLLGKLASEQFKQYPANSSINDVEFRVYSQFGEDGIIQFLIHHLNKDIKNKIFIEIGVEDYSEANTRFLLENNVWKGVIIDACNEKIKQIHNSDFLWRNHLLAINKFITKDNINEVIREINLPGNIGLFSLDIDGNDYWVLESLLKNSPNFRPDIIIVEYNSFFGSELPISLPYREDFVWQKYHPVSYFGASLPAFCYLLEKYGYSLVGSTHAGNNAFFVKDEINQEKLRTVTCKQGYKQAIFNSMPCSTFHKFEEQLLPLRYQQVIDVQNNTYARLSGEPITHYSIQEKFNCIQDFMLYENEEFVANAYRYLLCREPDNSEIEIFMKFLRQNTPKEDILKMIRFSDEGARVNVSISGLFKSS